MSGQVDSNFDAFRSLLPELMRSAPGKFVLMHNGVVIEAHDTSVGAFLAGLDQFGDGEYSVQEVSDQPENLGFYSYVGGTGHA
jgi:hypothetical protein